MNTKLKRRRRQARRLNGQKNNFENTRRYCEKNERHLNWNESANAKNKGENNECENNGETRTSRLRNENENERLKSFESENESG